MAVGQGSLFSGFSYVAVGRETTYGTYTTATATLPFISAGLKTMKESKILEQIETSRTYSKHISLGRVIEGEVEFYVYPLLTSTGYLLENAFGATATSATATGETAGGTAFTHTFTIGHHADTYKALCMNVRKGDSSAAKIFEYSGLKIDEINFTAELDEALKASISLVGKDSTLTTNDVSASMTVNTTVPLTFSGGRVSVESSFASLTSTSFWHVQSVEFGITNSVKSDSESRRIGTDTLDVAPVGIASFPLQVTMRFDTSTAYDAMIAASELSLELEFTGDTMSTSVIKQGLKFQYPVVRIKDAGDPEIGGPDEVLQSTVVFDVLRDDSSATGYALKAYLTNNISAI